MKEKIQIIKDNPKERIIKLGGDLFRLNKTCKVFFSHSFYEKHQMKIFILVVKEILEKWFGFKTETVGLTSSEDRNAFFTIRDKIKESDFVVCCFSKDYPIEEKKYLTRASIYMEFTMSKIQEKNTVVLVEDGNVLLNDMLKGATTPIFVILNDLKGWMKNNQDVAFIRNIEGAIEEECALQIISRFGEKIEDE